MSRAIPPAYKTRNWPAHSEALKRRGSLTIWFDPAKILEAAPTGKRGRQPDDSDAAIQTFLTIKVLFGMALTPGAIARNEALRASKRLGRTIWRRWSGYHRRSRIDTKTHCVKLLGQRLMARDFDRQVAEFQVRVAVLNGFTALGIPVTEAVG